MTVRTEKACYLQPPVGNTTVFDSEESNVESLQSGLKIFGAGMQYFDSGTMALAAALRVVCNAANCRHPAVVLPAYGCPDLLSAVRFVGASPIFVDVEPNGLGFDLSKLNTAMNASTDVVAIVATELFGIAENGLKLRGVADDNGVRLIQDVAQSIQPWGRPEFDYFGDMIVFSFGRGKPVCLLGGGGVCTGAVESKESKMLAAEHEAAVKSTRSRFRLHKISLYNACLNPRLYYLVSRLLGNRLGQTRYVALEKISRPDPLDTDLIRLAVRGYWKYHTDRAADVHRLVRQFSSSQDPAWLSLPNGLEEAIGSRRLIRYPVLLASEEIRREVIHKLRSRGISATKMYGQTLPSFDTSSRQLSTRNDFPNANHIAMRLMTLPIHARLSNSDLSVIAAVFESVENC